MLEPKKRKDRFAFCTPDFFGIAKADSTDVSNVHEQCSQIVFPSENEDVGPREVTDANDANCPSFQLLAKPCMCEFSNTGDSSPGSPGAKFAQALYFIPIKHCHRLLQLHCVSKVKMGFFLLGR